MTILEMSVVKQNRFGNDFYDTTMEVEVGLRGANWFCNKPLNTEIQCTNISSSDDSANAENSNLIIADESANAENISSVRIEAVPNNAEGSESSESGGNSGEDSDYIPDTSSEADSESDKYSTVSEVSAVIPESKKIIISQNIIIREKDDVKSDISNGNYHKKNRNICMFCEDKVLNFARHLERNHYLEIDVQRMLALPKGSKAKKEILSSLRKKGNYLGDSENGKPVRNNVNTSYLPCTYCLGFYSAKNLWKHRKICKEGPKLSTGPSQIEGQNFLLRHLKIDPKLKDTVFPRMRADQVSMAAKKDKLICNFASRYIKIHREQHFVNVASRKMRELGKLLIEVKKLDPKITDLFHALKPNYYDLLISATKTVAKYDAEREYYESPTYAINMGTTLKQCCDIAIKDILRRKNTFGTMSAAEAEEELKTTVKLIEAHWKYDISSQASNDLNVKKWNRISLVPLASDLKILKEYLIKKSEEAISNLNQNRSNRNAYIVLLETVFCRTILLNRRRPGELQRFLLHTYETSLANDDSKTYEEFSEAISEVETFLMKHFKRVVIRGKRGRGVPVLFSKDVQSHIKILMTLRGDITQKSNIYLFGNPNSSKPFCGYKVLKKYVLASGAKNPEAITCTRLRKHLATLTQLFNLTENDMEQLSMFMGHSLGVHRSSYRLPDDVYQTAKISKLLLLMEKGEAGQFKGKTLEEIHVDLEEDLLDMEDKNNNELLEAKDTNEDLDELIVETIQSETTQAKRKSDLPEKDKQIKIKTENKFKKRVLIPWTENQKRIVLDFFKEHIKRQKPPKKSECEELKEKYQDLLKNKDWQKIKVYIQNQYIKK